MVRQFFVKIRNGESVQRFSECLMRADGWTTRTRYALHEVVNAPIKLIQYKTAKTEQMPLRFSVIS
jgi:hypothetical protein